MGCCIHKSNKNQTFHSYLCTIGSIIYIKRWVREWKKSHVFGQCDVWVIQKVLAKVSESDKNNIQQMYNALLLKMHSINPIRVGNYNAIENIAPLIIDEKKFKNYNGPNIQFPVSLSIIKSVILFFNTDRNNLMHPNDVCNILQKSIELLRTLPNINMATTGIGKRISVVGNIFGSWNDLITIFYKNNLPSVINPYIFNGDLIDKGSSSIEVLLVVLLCFLAFPYSVYLNRGCHEDPIMNREYGFEDELKKKYKKSAKDIFLRIVELYSWMPLATIVNNKIFVVHGGITNKTTIDSIYSIHRSSYKTVRNPPNFESSDHEFEWLQIMDLLWSNPNNKFGCHKNEQRGMGVTFGVDITENFLRSNNLDCIIRSHDCKREGFEISHQGQVCTIFSRSNFYGKGSNKGCYVVINSIRELIPFFYWPSKNSCYKIEPKCRVDNMENLLFYYLQNGIKTNISNLENEFRQFDEANSGHIMLNTWCQIIAKYSLLHLPWLTLALIMDSNYLTGPDHHVLIDYQVTVEKMKSRRFEELLRNTLNLSDLLYKNRAILQNLFQILDVNGTGQISINEFKESFSSLHPYLQKINKPDIIQIFKFLDFNHDNFIDLNDFFECFRLAVTNLFD